MKLLWINAFHGDASAVARGDGAIILGVEEELSTWVKHWAGFPREGSASAWTWFVIGREAPGWSQSNTLMRG
jgi:predicted NodU family carbamoyl transferase